MPEATWAQILEGVEEAAPLSYEPLPEGNYDFTVTGGEERQTQSGKTQLSFRLQVVSEGPNKGKTAFLNQTISPENPNAMGIFLRTIINLGIEKQWLLSENPANTAVIAKAIGATFKGAVKHRVADGKTNVNIYVNELISAGGGTALPATGGPTLPAPVTVAPASPAVAAPAAPVAEAPVAAAPPAMPPATGNPFRV